MISRLKYWLMALAGAFLCLPAFSQARYALEVGSTRDIATYLSPLYYRGQDYALTGSWTSGFPPARKHLDMRFEAELHFQDMKNRAGTAVMLGGMARFGWGVQYRLNFGPHWRVGLGGALNLEGGALWLTRNGNNPVNAIGSLGLDLTASARYQFRMGRLPVTVTDFLRLPSLSAFFCPEYGETYYEIYLGNRQGLVHCGWWGNAVGVENELAATLHFGRYSLVVGYRLRLMTQHANYLDTRLLSNAFLIGWQL